MYVVIETSEIQDSIDAILDLDINKEFYSIKEKDGIEYLPTIELKGFIENILDLMGIVIKGEK